MTYRGDAVVRAIEDRGGGKTTHNILDSLHKTREKPARSTPHTWFVKFPRVVSDHLFSLPYQLSPVMLVDEIMAKAGGDHACDQLGPGTRGRACAPQSSSGGARGPTTSGGCTRWTRTSGGLSRSSQRATAHGAFRAPTRPPAARFLCFAHSLLASNVWVMINSAFWRRPSDYVPRISLAAMLSMSVRMLEVREPKPPP